MFLVCVVILALFMIYVAWYIFHPNCLRAIILGNRDSGNALRKVLSEELGICESKMLNVEESYLEIRDRLCVATLGNGCGILPVAVLLDGSDIKTIIIGIPSDELISGIREKIADKQVYLVYSGPSLFLSTGCSTCLYSEEIRVIMPLPEDKVDSIRRTLLEISNP